MLFFYEYIIILMKTIKLTGDESMAKITIDAHGKINLSLDVLSRRQNGYHELRMIMQQIALKDIITIAELDKGIRIESNNPNVPTDSSNLVYKASKLLSSRYNIHRGLHIYIEKNIPIAAGLAGGSSNAAAVLKGLNKIWNLDLSLKELMDIGLKIGADVPYCLMGGTALAEGVGEQLTKLPDFSNKLILLANPGVPVSTAYVFKGLDLSSISKRPNTDGLITAIKEDNLDFVANNMVNLLETVTIKDHPIIEEIKVTMIKHGALGSIMSGSGPTVFGIFNDSKAMRKCKEVLDKKINIVIETVTL